MNINELFKVSLEWPDKNDFYALYEGTGWNDSHQFTPDDLHKAILNSWYMVNVYDGNQLIGTGRIISDGVYQTFVCDLIVHQDYQGKGIGTFILNHLMAYCKGKGLNWLQLTSANGKRSFYEQFGFTARPSDGPGMEIRLT